MDNPCKNEDLRKKLIEKVSINHQEFSLEQINKAINTCCEINSNDIESCVIEFSNQYKSMGILFENKNEKEKMTILIECVNQATDNNTIYTEQWRDRVIEIIKSFENK
jgi:hypothetical protein